MCFKISQGFAGSVVIGKTEHHNGVKKLIFYWSAAKPVADNLKNITINYLSGGLTGNIDLEVPAYQRQYSFECKKEYKDRLKKLITGGLKAKLGENVPESVNLRKHLSIARNKLEKIGERYALGEITQDVFQNFSDKYSYEIAKTEQLLTDQSFDSSNLEKTMEKALENYFKRQSKLGFRRV